MFGHLPEFFIILVIGLIIFGPEKLPEVAGQVGRMVREVRSALDVSLNPQDVEVPTDFSTYYYESLARSGEDINFHEGADQELYESPPESAAGFEEPGVVDVAEPDSADPTALNRETVRAAEVEDEIG